MTDLTKPEPPEERLRHVLTVLMGALHGNVRGFVKMQTRDVTWMAEKIAGVVRELEGRGGELPRTVVRRAVEQHDLGGWFCKCGNRSDAPGPCASCRPPVLNLAERGAR